MRQSTPCECIALLALACSFAGIDFVEAGKSRTLVLMRLHRDICRYCKSEG